jgi:pSer/pThr/pTyr-binding forkhead associated (FHA) protein
MPLNAKLGVVGGDVKTEEFKLRLPSTVGRGKGTTIMLVHPLVSRKHCELYEAEGQLMVRDLGSLNGTFADGVWWVDLAAISVEERLVQAIAHAAHLQLADGKPTTVLARAL